MFVQWNRNWHISDHFKNSEIFLWFHFLCSNGEETSPHNYTVVHVNSRASSAIETDESWLFVSLFVSRLPRSRCMAGTKEFRKNIKMTTPRTVKHLTRRILSVILCCKRPWKTCLDTGQKETCQTPSEQCCSAGELKSAGLWKPVSTTK